MTLTFQEIVKLAAATPKGEPIGLTRREYDVFRAAVLLSDTPMVRGRRLVIIPDNWRDPNGESVARLMREIYAFHGPGQALQFGPRAFADVTTT